MQKQKDYELQLLFETQNIAEDPVFHAHTLLKKVWIWDRDSVQKPNEEAMNKQRDFTNIWSLFGSYSKLGVGFTFTRNRKHPSWSLLKNSLQKLRKGKKLFLGAFNMPKTTFFTTVSQRPLIGFNF